MMSKSDIRPKASSTAVKSKNQRSYRNHLHNTINNETFSSMFSDELSENDLVKKTFSEMSSNKNNFQMDSVSSSLSEQSSLGILELNNMSDIGNTFKKEPLSFNCNKQPSLQQRLSQASQVKNTLARASSIKNIFNKSTVNDKSVRTSLTNITNAFEDMLKEGMNDSNYTFTCEDFISASEFKENLAEIEEVNRKEFGSLSESRFNFSLEGENQSINNGSYAAKYFAAKSVPIGDLSVVFPKRSTNDEDFPKKNYEKHCSFLDPHDLKQKQESQEPVGYKTMSSITSWTDSHVSNDLLNLSSLSEISDVLASKTNSTNPKELTKALLSGAFSSLDSFKYIPTQEKILSNNNYSMQSNSILDNNVIESSKQNCSKKSQINVSTHINKKQTKHVTNDSNFILTPKSGYFEDCLSETNITENNVNLSNFSIMTNHHDVFTEMSLNKSANVSKVVYSNETLHQNKLNLSHIQDYKTLSEVLEIGDICIGTYSQAIITLENCLTINAEYTLNLLDVSLNYTKNNMFVENKSVRTNIATVLCSDKIKIIPASTETSFTIGIIPLVSGSINIFIKLESNDVSQDIYRNIQIHSIEPQITWVNNSFGSIDFGLLPELSQKSFPIKLLNKGLFQVPIKFILNQDQHEDTVLAKAIINPSELWQCDVNILTKSFFINNNKTNLITGRLRVMLDSVEELSPYYSPLLFCSNLSGRAGQTCISFDHNPLILKRNGQSSLNGILEVSNNSELPICLYYVQQNNKNCSQFSIQPDQFHLAVNEKIKLKIVHIPSKSLNYFNETSVCFQVLSSQKQFFVKINCIESYSELQQISSPSSRPISPWSSTSSTSSSSAVGQLELESTSSSLIWGSIPSNTKSVQTFTLRNRGSHKEKLILSIKDNKNCFKLISSGENHVSEMKLLLEPMESQKLCVALISTSNEGQAYGKLVLQRQRSNEKRVISLFGYCGHSVVMINGTFEDNFGNMWLYPNPQFMSAQFSVTNSGNTTAFVNIFQESSASDIIEPNELILKKGETKTVEVTVIMSPERLEMLLEEDSNSKVININKISLIHGDEVTRVRVSRLWNKVKHEKKMIYTDQQRLDKISSMFNGVDFVNVDHLIDTEKSLLKLWKTGISEDSIVILMEKSNLESLLCDTTTIFSELETTIISRP